MVGAGSAKRAIRFRRGGGSGSGVVITCSITQSGTWSRPTGPTWDNQIARLRNAYDNVQRVARGEPPLWVVPELSDLVM